MSVFRATVALLLAGTLSACGAASTGVGSTAGRRTQSVDAAQPCTLFTASVITRTLDIRVGPGMPQPGATSSRCLWRQRDRDEFDGYSVSVDAAAVGLTSLDGEVAAQPRNYRRTSPRVGVDSAFYTAPGRFSDAVVGLVVLAGGHRWQLLVQRPNGLADPGVVRNRLLTLAETAF